MKRQYQSGPFHLYRLNLIQVFSNAILPICHFHSSPFPDDIVPEIFTWKTISSWYFVSSHPLYFDMMREDFTLHRFQIILAPDLSTVSLHVINTHEPIPHDFVYVSFEDYRICEDTLVCCSLCEVPSLRWGVYTGLTSPSFANVISRGSPAAKMLLPDIGHKYFLSSCPASGRFIRLESNNSVAVLDFF